VPRERARKLRREEVEITQIPSVGAHEPFLIIDERYKVPIATHPYFTKLGGRAELLFGVSLQHYYDDVARIWRPLTAVDIASVQCYHYFFPTDPTPLTTAQWTHVRVDSLRRTLLSPEAGLAPLHDETVTGVLRSIGDAGATPANITCETLLQRTSQIQESLKDETVKGLLRSIGDAGATPANTTGYTALGRLAEIHWHLRYLYEALDNLGENSVSIKVIVGAGATYDLTLPIKPKCVLGNVRIGTHSTDPYEVWIYQTIGEYSHLFHYENLTAGGPFRRTEGVFGDDDTNIWLRVKNNAATAQYMYLGIRLNV